jgi:hypothetical protein
MVLTISAETIESVLKAMPLFSIVCGCRKEAVLRLLVMAVAYFYARFYVLLTFPSLRGYDKDLLVCFFSL